MLAFMLAMLGGTPFVSWSRHIILHAAGAGCPYKHFPKCPCWPAVILKAVNHINFVLLFYSYRAFLFLRNIKIYVFNIFFWDNMWDLLFIFLFYFSFTNCWYYYSTPLKHVRGVAKQVRGVATLVLGVAKLVRGVAKMVRMPCPWLEGCQLKSHGWQNAPGTGRPCFLKCTSIWIKASAKNKCKPLIRLQWVHK